MRLRNQNSDAPANRVAAAGGEDTNQSRLRERSAALLAAADEAISRALSGDSVKFLTQNRQAGGE